MNRPSRPFVHSIGVFGIRNQRSDEMANPWRDIQTNMLTL